MNEIFAKQGTTWVPWNFNQIDKEKRFWVHSTLPLGYHSKKGWVGIELNNGRYYPYLFEKGKRRNFEVSDSLEAAKRSALEGALQYGIFVKLEEDA